MEAFIEKELYALRDEKFREFHCRLMPNVEAERVIGVRTPEQRKLAKKLYGMPGTEKFMLSLPHRYYEENNLHGMLIELIKDYDKCILELDRFLPYVDNWATCDCIRPKIFKKHLQELLVPIYRWIASDKPYVVRFGIEMLMCYYLDEHFDVKYPRLVASVESDEYYVNMMIAWYFATALAKQYDVVIPYIKERKLSKDVHNKIIQKAIESYRVTDEHKEYLRTLRWNTVR